MKYHLIGNMGISMGAIDHLLKNFGHVVTGSDLKSGGHKAENITSDIDFVVRTSAVTSGSEGWVEVLRANELHIPVIKRSELLGEITDKYDLIAVSGAHGKTTTTALVSLCLIEAGVDPTVLVGEKIKEFGNEAFRIGNSNYFVMESCEYDRSFLDFHPKMAVITNIDLEHLDTYPGGIEEIRQAFLNFVLNIRPGGVLVYFKEDENLVQVVKEAKREDIKLVGYGREDFDEYRDLLSELRLLGEHNKLNAISAIKICEEVMPDRLDVIKKVFSNFLGAKRRMEFWGEFGDNLVYDDYGHHPSEIRATILAISEKFPDRPITVIFWPHQYKRIMPLVEQFGKAFSGASEILLKPIFLVPGRDLELPISSEDLAEKIRGNYGTQVTVFKTDEEIIEHIRGKKEERGIILTLGIPPIYKVAEMLTEGNENG